MRKRGRFTLVGPVVDRRVVVICLTLITSKPSFTNSSETSSAGVFIGRWRITAFTGFSDLEKKVKQGRFSRSKYSYVRIAEKSAISLVITLVPFLVERNSKLPLHKPFSYFCSRIKFSGEVSPMGGGLPVLLACLC
jgi:hypothetical protein